MKKYTLTAELEVEDHDADVMSTVAQAVLDRFAGTAVKVSLVSVEARIAS